MSISIFSEMEEMYGEHFDSRWPGRDGSAAPLEMLAGVLMPELLQTIRKPAVNALPGMEHEGAELMQLFSVERESRRHAIGHVAAGMSLLIALLVQIHRLQQTQLATPFRVTSRKTAQVEKFRALVEKHFKEHLSMQKPMRRNWA